MANEIVKTTFRGQEIELKPKMGILCEFQRITGKQPFAMDWRKEAGPVEFCILFSCALAKAGIEVTPAEVEEEMTGEHIEVIGELIQALMAEKDPEKKTLN